MARSADIKLSETSEKQTRTLNRLEKQPPLQLYRVCTDSKTLQQTSAMSAVNTVSAMNTIPTTRSSVSSVNTVTAMNTIPTTRSCVSAVKAVSAVTLSTLLLLLLLGTTAAEVARGGAPRAAGQLTEYFSGPVRPPAEDLDVSLWSSRQPRSPISPPTVASQQPYRKGISLRMMDSSLQVGQQSEGPSHPSLMRKTPPRKQSTIILEDEQKLARPHTLFQIPKRVQYTQSDDYPLQDTRPQHAQYTSDRLQYPADNRYHTQNPYVEYDESTNSDAYYDYQETDKEMEASNQAEDERRSRQRRVENSQRREGNVRHGRFEEFLGDRGNIRGEQLERYDTFGLPISEELWTGARRSANPIHPAAQAIPNRSREPSVLEDNSIWSRGPSRRYGRPFSTYPQSRDSNTGQQIIIGERFDGRSNGNVLFHPGARMTSRGSASKTSGGHQPETVIIYGGSSSGRSGHHGMFIRPRVQNSPSLALENTVSLEDVMNRMNQTYEELNRNLEIKGLSLTYLLRLLSKGAPLEEVVTILEFSNPHAISTTTLEPLMEAIDPHVWEEWLNQEIEKENREIISNHPVEIDRKMENIPYYSDPIYANGVHPINENLDNSDELGTSTEIPYDGIYHSNLSYDDYHSEVEDDRKTSGQARIHSFTVHELPYEENDQADATDYLSGNHPHFNQWDQTYEANDIESTGILDSDFLPQSSSNVLLKPLTEGNEDWGSSSGDAVNKSRPLTYTIIAACGIMGSLAIFTFFVLIAYTVVKCTKKPTLNNYQVNDKKPVEITA